MTSIRAKLTCWLSIAMTALAVTTGCTLYFLLYRLSLADFDATLASRVDAIRSLTKQKGVVEVDFDFTPDALDAYAGPSATAWFELRRPDGTVIAASSPTALLPVRDLPASGGPFDAILFGTLPVRAQRVQFDPAPDDEDDERPSVRHEDAMAAAAPSSGVASPLLLTVAQDRRPFDAQTRRIALTVASSLGLLSLAAVLTAIAVVRFGLRPLASLANEVSKADFKRPGVRFSEESLPAELRPVAGRLDELLNRVAATLARERRFSADVAHELRTPIAELRAAAEVALRDPDNVVVLRRSARQSVDIAGEMQAMVTALLQLVRQEGTPASELRPVALAPVLERATARYRQLAAERSLSVSTSAGADLLVLASDRLLDAVVDNLVANACRYATPGGRVRVAAGPAARSVECTFDNDDATLAPADLEAMFEPFWRKDAARGGGTNVGLGLSLARAYCDAMGVSLDAELPAAGRFRVRLRFTAAEASSVVRSIAEVHATEVGV